MTTMRDVLDRLQQATIRLEQAFQMDDVIVDRWKQEIEAESERIEVLTVSLENEFHPRYQAENQPSPSVDQDVRPSECSHQQIH